MNCIYCDSEMYLDRNYYKCYQINGFLDHSYEFAKNNSYVEFRFYIDKDDYNYDIMFYSVSKFNNINSENSYHLEDFSKLKQIKNSEQLQFFINKLKVFK